MGGTKSGLRTPSELLAGLVKTAILGIPDGFSLRTIEATFLGSRLSKPRRGPHGLLMGNPAVNLTVIDEETMEAHDLILCMLTTQERLGREGIVLREARGEARVWSEGGERIL